MTTDKAKKTTKTAATTKAKAKAFRYAVRLEDESKSRLIISATEMKDGKFRAAVGYRTNGAKAQRAMITYHATALEATEKANALAKDAVALGWTLKAKKTRTPTAPAFVTIPKPSTKVPAFTK